MRLLPLLLSILALAACRSSAITTSALSVRGTVVDAGGRPIEGVRYWVSALEEHTSTGWQLVQRLGMAEMRFTSADGRFEVSDPEGLRYDVDFDCSGYAPAFVQQAESGTEMRVVLERGRDVRGRIVQRDAPGTHPVGYGRVSIHRPNARGLWFQTDVLADADGAFTFAGFLSRTPPSTPDPGWQLVCAGAVHQLSVSPDGPVPEIVIEIAFRTGP